MGAPKNSRSSQPEKPIRAARTLR